MIANRVNIKMRMREVYGHKEFRELERFVRDHQEWFDEKLVFIFLDHHRRSSESCQLERGILRYVSESSPHLSCA